MQIGALSKRSGVSIHTIRFYERSGLIKGRRKAPGERNNYLDYDEETVERLLLIRDAKSIGFTIGEIGRLIDVWFNDQITTPEKLKVLDEKLLSIEARIKELKEMKKLIAGFKQSVLSEEC